MAGNRWIRTSAFLAALLLVLVACGDDGDPEDDGDAAADAGDTDDGAEPSEDDGDDATDGADGDADGDASDADAAAQDGCTEDRSGGSLTMGTYSPTRGLDPAVFAGSGLAGTTEGAAVYDVLVRYNPESNEYEPWLAESLEPNDDFTEWRLTLPEGVEYGNGDELTTEDVRFNLERYASDEVATSTRQAAQNITSIEIVDDYTMVLGIDATWPGFPAVLAEQPGMVVNPRVLEEIGAEQLNLDPVGAGVGPYEIETFAPGEEIVLTAKDNYWGGPVCIEELRFIWIPGAQPTYEAFELGELDVAILREAETVADANEAGHDGFSSIQHFSETLLINNIAEEAGAPTDDVRLRQAVVHAIDPVQVDERGRGGDGIPTSALLPEGAPWKPDVGGPEHDPDRAAELVEEVKADGWDGSIRLDADSGREDEAIAMAAQLEAVGFDVELDTSLTIGELIPRVQVDRNFALITFGQSFDESNAWFRLSGALGTGGSINETGHSSPEMDAALDQLQQAETDDDYRAAFAEIQRLWNEAAPQMNLASVEERVIWQDEVRGIVPTSRTVPLFNGAWLDQ